MHRGHESGATVSTQKRSTDKGLSVTQDVLVAPKCTRVLPYAIFATMTVQSAIGTFNSTENVYKRPFLSTRAVCTPAFRINQAYPPSNPTKNKMHYSFLLTSLAVLTAASPVQQKSTDQAADTSYGSYGIYDNYKDYAIYHAGVEKEAMKQGQSGFLDFGSCCH